MNATVPLGGNMGLAPNLDTFTEALLSTPIWGCAITAILLVVANRMSKTPTWHNTVLLLAWGLCVASLYFTRPVSDMQQGPKVAVTTASAVCLGVILYWLFWESVGSVISAAARKVVSKATKLLRKTHHMHPLNAIRECGAVELSNHDLIHVNHAIALRGYAAPFNDAIQEKDYLRFLRFFRENDLPIGTDPEIYEAAKRFYLSADHNPLIAALEELDVIYSEGDHMATLFQCRGAKLPTFSEAVAWNEKAVAFAKRTIFSVSAQDWAKFKENWNFADCQRIERVLRQHGYLEDATDGQCATFRYLWGRVKRLGELIAQIKGLSGDEKETPIESLTDFLLKVHSLLDVFANLASPLFLAEQNDLFATIRQFLRKNLPEYVDRFNEIVSTKLPTRNIDFPEEFSIGDMEEWSRTRREPCDRLHAVADYLTRIVSDLRSKLPS